LEIEKRERERERERERDEIGKGERDREMVNASFPTSLVMRRVCESCERGEEVLREKEKR